MNVATQGATLGHQTKLVGLWLGYRLRRAPPAMLLTVLLAGASLVGCGGQPFALDASGPFVYPADVNPPFERVAIIVTITNRSGDDMQVNPADFVARDTGHRVYPANPTAADAELRLGRLAIKPRDMPDVLPLPVVTLRQDDVISGFVVFDLPVGTRPVELVWRQSDTDYAVQLAATR